MNDELADEVSALCAVFGDDACTAAAEGGVATVEVEVAPKVRLLVTLPRGYPRSEDAAGVAARMVPALKSSATTVLNAHVAGAVAAACADGAAVLYDLVTWVQEELLPALAPAEAAAGADGGAGGGGADVVLCRQWLWFIGFYTKSIRQAFCETAASLGCTGFLMPGKPAVAAVEGTQAAINEFLRVTRTELFAKVAPSARKMTLMLLDDPIAARAFDGFEEVELLAAPSTHKRKDIADLGSLETFLADRQLTHAFNFIFNTRRELPDA